jgi:acyl-CoA synthetase (AMP-forming)/AMP-acid ligase II/acyl carrier protein
MKSPVTLIQALGRSINSSATISFINGANETRQITYGKLIDRSLGLLYHFQQKGLGETDQLIIISQRNDAFLEGFWAALFGGVVAVPLSFGISDEHKWKLFRILKQLSKPWIMLDQANVLRLEKFAQSNNLTTEWEGVKQRLFVIENIPNFTGHGKVVDVKETDTAFIQFSSGSTGEPKGVVLSHKNLVTNIIGIGHGMKITSSDSTFSWMPLTHDMGLIGFHLVPTFFGINQYIMPVEVFIRRPMLWLEKISQLEATVTCSPNFGYRHCLNAWSGSGMDGLNLNHVRLIFNGAEPISVPLTNEFLDAFGQYGLQRNSMFTVYGMAEASLAVAFPEAEVPFKYVTLNRNHLATGRSVLPAEDGLPFVIEGKAVLGTRLRVMGEDENILPPNYIGSIEIKGDNVTAGYLNKPELNKQMIVDGWLKTGDLGFLTDDEELVVTGREKDIIFISGNNFYPHDIEAIAELNLGIENGKIAACGVRLPNNTEDSIILFVLHKGADATFYPQVAEIKRTVGEIAGVKITEVVPIAKMPKTTSGKIQRYILGEGYLDGVYDDFIIGLNAYYSSLAVSEIGNDDYVESKLKIILEELLPGQQIGLDDNFFEIGATSLLLAQIHQRVDEQFPGALEVTDFFEYPTIAQLTDYIKAKTEDNKAHS